MKYLQQFGYVFVLPVAAAGLILMGYTQTNSSNHLCHHQYALCTSALCIPVPHDPSKAVCSCDVEEGANMSTVPCDTIKPASDANGIRTVYSTFSLEQFNQGKKSMKCPDGTPWTWCLNKRCTVDPSNSKKAICICDVVRKGEWTTLGGNCDTKTCKTGYWSGATLSAFDEGNKFMTKVMGLDKSPAKWCPSTP